MSADPLMSIDQWGPEKVVIVSDRRSSMRGVLVIDNTSRGTGKGGTRMSPTLTVAKISRLARTMTWKWAAVDLFHGGAKAGILGDPQSPEKERILRAFARALTNEVPREYMFGLDMGLAEQDAAIFVDELNDRGVSTGIPRALGGLAYDQLGLTGYGVAESAEAAAHHSGFELKNARVAVQGFGAVGRAAVERLDTLGAQIVAVATASGCIHDPSGLDVPTLVAGSRVAGDDVVKQYSSFRADAQAIFAVPTDVLIPAATADVITDEVAASTTAQLIVEGANLPTTASARHVLHQRGVVVVPDFIANAGGIIAAAHSSDSRNSPFVVEPDGVFAMISQKLRTNATRVLGDSQTMKITSLEAAHQLAKSRVMAAMEARGLVLSHGPTEDTSIRRNQG